MDPLREILFKETLEKYDEYQKKRKLLGFDADTTQTAYARYCGLFALIIKAELAIDFAIWLLTEREEKIEAKA